MSSGAGNPAQPENPRLMRPAQGADEAARDAQAKAARVPIGAAGPKQPVRVEDAYFEAAVCRNCSAPLETPFCSACGQKQAARFRWRDLRRETWEHWRVFELTSVRTLWRLASSPGYVAREYVMGRRKDHMHPLKLLLVIVALMVLVQSYNNYFAHYGYSSRADRQIDRMAALIQSYANWSFSTGVFAVFSGSWLVYRARLGYNAMEHAVLAVYCQIIIMAALIINLLPTTIWNSPEFVSDYKEASKWYMYAVKAFIVGLAFKQFFLVDLRREWPRLIAAVLLYMAASWALLRLFAYMILKIVQFQLP